MKHSILPSFIVEEGCIGCRACEGIAPDNFAMTPENIAFLQQQPQTEEEVILSDEALSSCPVGVIKKVEAIILQESNSEESDVILPATKVRETIINHPEIMDLLINLSPKFKRLKNKIFWNSVARFATFQDAAKMTGVSICEILHTMNAAIGSEEALSSLFPDCIKVIENKKIPLTVEMREEGGSLINVIGRELESLEELFENIKSLQSGDKLLIKSSFEINALVEYTRDLGFEVGVVHENPKCVKTYISNTKQDDWKNRLASFEKLDVRKMKSDPFDVILTKAYNIDPGQGFVLIQSFVPTPLINMLSSMDFEHHIEEKGLMEQWVYFHKMAPNQTSEKSDSDKVDIVIQSATPVAYPIIMRLLQSEIIRNSVNIKELKVWEETEKHLGWIVSGRVDVSFTALITASKLAGHDIKMPAVFVWDNFVILTRGYKATTFDDLAGKSISTPLFKEAPPTAITRTLMNASGFDSDKVNFLYGNPFGRPEEILKDFVDGKTDTCILREPEASFAVHAMEEQGVEYSILSYNDLWNRVYEGYGSFPNAGIVFKGEFARKHPDLVRIFLSELKKSIEWVGENRKESARLSFDMMRHSEKEVERFLDNVNFTYVDGPKLQNSVGKYITALNDADITDISIDPEFLSTFAL
jgi:NitT/TauT family transport system substrate-binding protein